MVAGGDGLGHLEDGRVVLVAGALPGETVLVDLAEQKKDWARGVLARVEVAAGGRRPPPCPLVGRGCGGCGWQHVDPGVASRLKASIVADALRRGAGIEHPVGVAAGASLSPRGYRTTARLAVTADGRLGYRRRRSAETVTVHHCLVAHPRLDEVIAATTVRGAGEVTLRVGLAGGERLAVVAPAPGAAVGVEAPTDVEVVYPGGRAWLREEVAGRWWRVSARAFFQSGPAAAQALVEAVDAAVGDALGPGDRLVDAYAGVGLLGGVVAARRQARLVAIESNREAAADAAVNLADLQASVTAGAVAAVGVAPGSAEVVIADPARPGLGRPGVDALRRAGAGRLVLVSCDPASLARDARLLGGAGYHLSRVEVLDLFPGTPHVEAVSTFER